MAELNQNWLYLIRACESKSIEVEQVLFTDGPERRAVWKDLLQRGFTQTEIDRMFNINRSPKTTRAAGLRQLKDEEWVQLTAIMSWKDTALTLYSPRSSATAAKRARIWKAAHNAGLQQSEIARAFNVSQQAVSKAVKKKVKTRQAAFTRAVQR